MRSVARVCVSVPSESFDLKLHFWDAGISSQDLGQGQVSRLLRNKGQGHMSVTKFPTPSPPLDNIRVMVIVWRLRGNIIRTALCRIVWHNVHSQQHTYMSNSYRSNRLALSHWNPYAVHRGGCLELYCCNMREWFWWDSSLIFNDQLVSFSALTLLVWSSGL